MDTTNTATPECRLAFLEGHAQGTTKRGDGFEARLKVLEAKIDAPIYVMEPAIDKRLSKLESEYHGTVERHHRRIAAVEEARNAFDTRLFSLEAAREPQQTKEAKPRFEVQRTLEGWKIVDTHHLGVTVWSSDMATAFDADRHCARLNAAAQAGPSLAAERMQDTLIRGMSDKMHELRVRAESAERERDEWKQKFLDERSNRGRAVAETLKAQRAVAEAVKAERERCATLVLQALPYSSAKALCQRIEPGEAAP